MTISPIPTGLDAALRTIPAPSADHVDIWAIDIRRFTPLPSSLAAVLTQDEIARASRFLLEVDRQRFSVARSILRHVLAACTGTPACDLEFERSAAGKPSLRPPHSSLAFNVSHSGSVVLLAWTDRPTVGVDVERMRPGVDVAALSEVCFSPREREVVLAGDQSVEPAVLDETSRRFFRYWACKESWIKADGRGMNLPLRSFTLVNAGDLDEYTVEAGTGLLPWRTRAFSTFDGYACAVTSDAGPWAIRLRHVG